MCSPWRYMGKWRYSSTYSYPHTRWTLTFTFRLRPLYHRGQRTSAPSEKEHVSSLMLAWRLPRTWDVLFGAVDRTTIPWLSIPWTSDYTDQLSSFPKCQCQSVFSEPVLACARYFDRHTTAWTRTIDRSLFPLHVNEGSKICANKQQRYKQENSRNERIILASVCILYCLTNVLLSVV